MRLVILLLLFVAAAVPGGHAAAADADTQAALTGSVVQCPEPVAINDAAAADAVTKASAADAAAFAGQLAGLPAKASETVRTLAGTHAIDRLLFARAYIAAVCGHLKEKGVPDSELHATLTKLSQDLLQVPAGLAGDGGAEGVDKAGGFSTLIEPQEKEEARPTEMKVEAAPEAAKASEEAPSQAPIRQEPATAKEAQPEAQATPALPDKMPDAVTAQPEATLKVPDQSQSPAEESARQPVRDEATTSDEEPGEEKSMVRRKKAKKAATGGQGLPTLGEDECRALGVMQNCLDLNSVLNQLLEKPLEYNRPDKMMVGRKSEISLVLRTDWQGKDLPPEVSEEFKTLPGEVKQGITKITRVMSAELSGSDFDVSPAGRQERTVVLPQPVTWNWQVTPIETGEAKPLRLRLYAHLQGPEGMMPPVLVKTLDATISVDVSTWDWVVGQAKALEPIYAIGAAIIGLLTALITYFLARGEAESATEQDEPTVRVSGPVLGDIGQSSRDSKSGASPATPPLQLPPASEEEDVPWKPKKPQSGEEGGSA